MAVNTLGNTGGPMDWLQALPKITRTYAIATFVVAAMLSWGIPGVHYLLLKWPSVWSGFQVWRLATHVLVVGKFSLPFLMQLVWILKYGAQLEAGAYEHHPEDFLFLFLFSTASFTALSLLGHLGRIAVLQSAYCGPSMVLVLIYVWSKEYPEENVTLYGIVKIKGFYLPFAFAALDMLMGASLVPSALGIAVGHAWYFLTVLLPRGSGQEYLKTPALVKRAAVALGVATPPPPARDQAATASGFRAFRGTARNLND